MDTRDVLKVLKLHSPTARAILRTFKTSLVPINHEMHSRSYDFLYLSNDDNLGLKLTITTHLNTLTQFTFGASLKLKRPMVNFTELLRNGPKSGHITAN